MIHEDEHQSTKHFVLDEPASAENSNTITSFEFKIAARERVRGDERGEPGFQSPKSAVKPTGSETKRLSTSASLLVPPISKDFIGERGYWYPVLVEKFLISVAGEELVCKLFCLILCG